MARNTAENKQNNKLMKAVIALLLVFILLLGGLLIYFFVIRPNADKGARGGQREVEALKGSIYVMTDEEMQEALNNVVEEGMFRISIASDIIAIEEGKAQVRIENNLQNRYIMQVSIYLDETGEEVYSTDLIDPGYYIQETTLDKSLEPGEYAATAVFTAFYPDSEEIVGTVGANVTIHVFPKGTIAPEA